MKTRIDQLLVERGLADSREKAQALILAGEVLINGQKADKPGRSVAADSALEVLAKLPFVSRGGLKLARALEHFNIQVNGYCLDVGSSTGGFTDCLLQAGATGVCAIDVGKGQLDWRLRNDPRVEVREGVNARFLSPADFTRKFDLAVCDASFISVTLLTPAMAPLLDPDHGQMVILVKPQFEVGKGKVGKGGIVRDPEQHQEACNRVRTCVQDLGFSAIIIDSPILGAEGNKEFLLFARRVSSEAK